MATNVSRKVAIIFEGDDRVSNVINGVSGNLDAFSSRISGVTGPLAGLTDQILLLEGALGVLAVGGLALALRESYEFETAVVSLQKILGDQAHLIDEVSEAVLDMSNEFGISAVQIQNGATDWKKAGFSVQETTTLVRESINLMIAAAETELEMANATEFLIAIMKGFKFEAEEAGRVVDVLNKVSNEYATSVTELATGVSKLSPIAKKMGFSLEETAAVLTPVIEIFRSGDEAATALRTGLLKIGDDASPVQGALEELGIKQFDLNGNMKSGRDILFEIAAAFNGLSEPQQLYLTKELVGIRQAAKMVDAFSNLGYAMEIHEVALNATGSRLAEVEARMNTFEKQLDRLREAFKNLGIAVGNEFKAAAKGAVEGATEIELQLQKLVKEGAFDDLFEYISDLADELGIFFQKVAAILPEAVALLDFSGLIESLKGLGGEIGNIFDAIFGDVNLTTPEGLAAFLQKLIDGFTGLQNVVAGILTGLEPFIRQVGKLIDSFINLSAESQKGKGEILGIAKGIDELLKIVPALTGALDLLSYSIGALTLTRIPAMLTGLGQLGSLTLTLGGAAGMGGLVTVVGLLSAGIGVLIGSLIKDIPIVKEIGEGLANIVLKLQGLDKGEIALIETRAKATEMAGKQAVEIVKLAEALGELPEQQGTEVLVVGSDEYNAELAKLEEEVKKFPESKETKLTAVPDTESAKAAVKTMFITVTGEAGDVWTVPVKVAADRKSLEDTKKTLEEIPQEKLLIAKVENQTKVEIERIQAQAQVLQTAFEWNAKVDIAEVEGHMETIRTLSDNLTTSFTNTGDVISSMVGDLAELTGYEAYKVLDYIEAESARRDRLLDAQIKLTNAEIKWLEAKAASVDRGDAAISVQMEGVYPELELIMWKVMERMQLQVNNEGLDLLL